MLGSIFITDEMIIHFNMFRMLIINRIGNDINSSFDYHSIAEQGLNVECINQKVIGEVT